jgi:hypothetical protein
MTEQAFSVQLALLERDGGLAAVDELIEAVAAGGRPVAILHELARDDAMITEPGNSERPLAGPFGLRIGRVDQAASAS